VEEAGKYHISAQSKDLSKFNLCKKQSKWLTIGVGTSRDCQ
jgi:hypothetical protein